MRTFKEYVNSRDQLFPSPPPPGALKTAGDLYAKKWGALQDRDPEGLRRRFLNNQRQMRSTLSTPFANLSTLAKNPQDLSKLRRNATAVTNTLYNQMRQQLSGNAKKVGK